eukprot:7619929-Pyramimonas_sp.AAC.1
MNDLADADLFESDLNILKKNGIKVGYAYWLKLLRGLCSAAISFNDFDKFAELLARDKSRVLKALEEAEMGPGEIEEIVLGIVEAQFYHSLKSLPLAEIKKMGRTSPA